MFCTACGAQVPDGTKFCTACGADLSGAPEGGSGGASSDPFANRFSSGPATGPVTPFIPPTNAKAQTGKWIGGGWELVKPDMVMWGLSALIILAVSGVVPIILQGALVAGLHLMFIKKLSGRTPEIGDLFKAFNLFVPTLVATLLISVFSFIGFMLCIVPGIVVYAVYMFTYLFIVDRKMDFWPAMEASHAVVKQDYLGFSLFVLALILLQMVGVLACFVGVLITFPIMYGAITIAYRDLVGFGGGAEI